MGAVARLGRRERRPRATRPPRAGARRRRRGHGRTTRGATVVERVSDCPHRSLPTAEVLAARRPAAGRSRAQGRASRSSTARRPAPPCWRWPVRTPAGWPAPPTSPRPCRSMRCAGSIHPFEARLHAARPVPGQAASAANLWALVERQPAQPVPRKLRQDPGRLRAALCAAGPRIGAGSPRLRAPPGRDRSQRGNRQPDGLRRHGRHRLRRQLPRRAGGARRRHARDRPGAAVDDQRAADRSAAHGATKADCRRSSCASPGCTPA